MARAAIKRIDIGHTVASIDVLAEGHKWLLYSLIAEQGNCAIMTDGRQYVKVRDLDEWDARLRQAFHITTVAASAVDLTCECIKRRMLKRHEWRPVPF